MDNIIGATIGDQDMTQSQNQQKNFSMVNVEGGNDYKLVSGGARENLGARERFLLGRM